MPEDVNQKISQFLDNELDHAQALNLLKKMQLQPDLQDKLNRYSAISHAMKTEAFLVTKADFSTKIRQQIQKEPFYLLPQPQHKSFKRSHKQIAVAASIVIVALIAGRSLNYPNQYSTSVSVAKASHQQLAVQSIKPIMNASQVAQYPLNKRINDYLQAHNSSVYTNGEANFQPLARVTAYSQK